MAGLKTPDEKITETPWFGLFCLHKPNYLCWHDGECSIKWEWHQRFVHLLWCGALLLMVIRAWCKGSSLWPTGCIKPSLFVGAGLFPINLFYLVKLQSRHLKVFCRRTLQEPMCCWRAPQSLWCFDASAAFSLTHSRNQCDWDTVFLALEWSFAAVITSFVLHVFVKIDWQGRSRPFPRLPHKHCLSSPENNM